MRVKPPEFLASYFSRLRSTSALQASAQHDQAQQRISTHEIWCSGQVRCKWQGQQQP